MTDYLQAAQAMWQTLSGVSWLEWAKVIVDLLKGIAWPLTAFLIVLLFRTQLGDRIRYLLSFGREGVVFEAPSQPTRQDMPEGIATKPLDESSLELQSSQHPFKSVPQVVAKIRSQLETLPDDQHIPQLMIALAEAQIERGFEMVWGLIFGSQLVALRKLKEAGPISLQAAQSFYETEVKPTNPAFQDWDFGQWSNFLLLQELVRIEHGFFMLTDIGSDFLTFVENRKKGQSKGL